MKAIKTTTKAKTGSGNKPAYTRDAAFDKRIGRGDDYAGDAWRDQYGLLRWVVVGVDPNTRA